MRAEKKEPVPFFLMIGGGVLGLALLEVALRLWWPQPMYATRPSYLGTSHAPGARFTYIRAEFRVPIAYNSFGLRDREYSPAKSPGTVRILCVGDSFTAGLEVPQDAAWTERLERRLNESHRGHPPVEVINAGVPSYGVDQMLLYYLREGARFEPDLVLLLHMGFTGREAEGRFARLVNGQLELREAKFPPAQLAVRNALGWLRWHSHVVAGVCDHARAIPAIARLADALKWAKDAAVVERRAVAMSGSNEVGALELTRALLTRFEEAAEKRRATFVVALGGPDARPIGPICRALGIDVLPLAEALQAHERGGAVLHYRQDGHWNAEGHRAVAAHLWPWLRPYVETAASFTNPRMASHISPAARLQ